MLNSNIKKCAEEKRFEFEKSRPVDDDDFALDIVAFESKVTVY